jgi:subtilisin-like proprotein convertase family protein
MASKIETGALAGLMVICVSAPGWADTLEATLGEPLHEIAHGVDVRVKGGTAVLKVRRSFVNEGKRHDEASLRIELPFGAAATGLRIRSAKRWYDGELMEAEKAAELYRELTGLGPHEPKDPALLQWVWPDEVHLQVFPVPPGRTATVEYTLTAPTRYVRGRHVISYPRGVAAKDRLATPVLRVRPESFGGQVAVDGVRHVAGQPLVLAPKTRPAWVDDDHLGRDDAFVVSELAVKGPGAARRVAIKLDLRHTYRGDLKVQLVTPRGRWHVIHDQQGDSDNDLSGRYPVDLGRRQRVAGTWRLVVSDHAPRDVGTLDAWALQFKLRGRPSVHRAKDTPVFIPDAPEEGSNASLATIAVAPPRIDTVAARLGRVVASKKSAFLRLEVEAAPRLRPMPRAPTVVFVVDASHSMKPTGIEAQLALARSFVAHVPDGRFQVMVFRRFARPLFDGLQRPRDFDRLVAAARAAGKLDPGNGSALDRGLRRAREALQGQGSTKHLFIVATTDALLRPAWRNAAGLRELSRAPAGCVAHVVLPQVDDGGPVEDTRDDDHALAPLAAARGGVLLQVSGFPVSDSKALDKVTLGLVRPIRIDGFSVDGAGDGIFDDLPKALVEGAGIREMIAPDRASAAVVLRGKIWAQPFKRVVRATPAFSRTTAAYVFSLDRHEDLSRAEMLKVAFFGRVVSPVTSYLAIEPGVRPSRAGIDRMGGGGSGAGYGRGAGRLGSRRARLPLDLRPLLAPAIKRCVARHRPARTWRVSLTVHTTFDEIVDVVLGGRPTPMGRCLAEEAWKLRLPPAFDRQRQRFDVELPARLP